LNGESRSSASTGPVYPFTGSAYSDTVSRRKLTAGDMPMIGHDPLLSDLPETAGKKRE
jgi:hypothetical protein